jgi:hypothetical protein
VLKVGNLDSMCHRQRRYARVVGSLAGHLAAVDKVEPAARNIRSLGEEGERMA